MNAPYEIVILVALAGCATPARPQPAPVPAAVDYERRDQPVTDADLEILVRADEILASEAVWNRHDTRECKPEDTTWSLFCALQRASIEVTGKYEHRAVALQEVRFAVEEATQGMDLHHRLMDYNNLASTRFADVKAVLRVATERVKARLGRPPAE
jgi:hypothetical protein